MAEEHFTSRRERREAERLAAEQAFEARSTPEPTSEPTPEPISEQASAPTPEQPAADDANISEPESRIDPNPSPAIRHERGALASDHLQESRPPVLAEDRLDPRRTPLPHFDSRSERKKYLREHGLSMSGDLSTGAIPVIAEADAEEDATSTENIAEPTPTPPGPLSPTTEPGTVQDSLTDHESYDAAGFGGPAAEVAARDFEAPMSAATSPRPSTVEGQRYDALSMPYDSLDSRNSDDSISQQTSADSNSPEPSAAPSEPSATPSEPRFGESSADTSTETTPTTSSPTESPDSPRPRSRRMPIVQPPTTAGVRVVTPNSAGLNQPETSAVDSPEVQDQTADTGSYYDESARAKAAHPETREMEAVPEAWALPNADYEDEETENPPAQRISARSVTDYDGQILVGEEPSKVPFIMLGVSMLVAVTLIVIALVMFL